MMRHWTSALCALGLATALVWAGSTPVTAQGAGSIVGEVKYSGTPPSPKTLKVNKDTQVCGGDKPSEELVVGANKGIKNAVVSLAGGKGPAPRPAQKPAFDQKGCQFVPHVLVVPAGGEVDILNSDGILHNIHTFSSANAAINKAQPKFKKVMTEKFDKPEIVKVQCDVHGWMQGWIVVAGHAHYAVSDGSGAFKLDNVPPGKHKVEVWHESLGKLSQEVEVKAGAPTKVTFELSKK
jgi:plastocyanin